MNKLGKYFSLSELTRTNKNLPNVPNSQQIENLQKLVENILDPLREKYGNPIRVNSGFRSAKVNEAVKGAKNSEHLSGCAADITAGNKTENCILFQLIRDNFTFRQLINEYDYSWIHVSFNEKDNKKQILAIK